MYKNLTLQQLSIFSAGIISLVFLILSLVLILVNWLEISVIYPLLATPALFAFSYVTNIKILEKYVYRRIKLIYKIIHKSKVSVSEKEESRIDDRILDKVESEVHQWAISQQEEIQSLKKLEKYRRNFLGNISHELKTPIFSIQGYIHTLIDGGMHDEEIFADYLRRAANNLDRLQTIVEDLEIISKLENETMILDVQPFDIRSLAEEVIRDVELQAGQRGINLSLKEGANRSYFVRADLEAVRTVLTNLLINSIKYGNEDGRTKIGFYDMDKYILVEVADNGLGIEEKHLKHVFDRFYRVDKSRSRARGGSGLGLSIVKHIIEAHKQTINVRSTIGMGSTFGFTLAKASQS